MNNLVNISFLVTFYKCLFIVCFKFVSAMFLKLLHFWKLWYYSIIILIGVSVNFVNFNLKLPKNFDDFK